MSNSQPGRDGKEPRDSSQGNKEIVKEERRGCGRKQTGKLEAGQDAAPKEPVNLKTVPFPLHFCFFLRQ